MRDTRSIRLSKREAMRVKAASAEAGVAPSTFLREAAVEVANLVLAGRWRTRRTEQSDRTLEFASGEN